MPYLLCYLLKLLFAKQIPLNKIALKLAVLDLSGILDAFDFLLLLPLLIALCQADWF